MTNEQAVCSVVDTLDILGVSYMLVGALSVSFYGIARSTKDADVVVAMGSYSATDLVRPLKDQGFQLDPQTRFETITGTTHHIIHIDESPFTVELFDLSQDPHDQERFRRRRSVTLLGRTVWLPTVEDVIITKLRWALIGGRSKDRDDVRNVIAVQEGNIDWDEVHRWCREHGTRALLDEIRASIPPI